MTAAETLKLLGLAIGAASAAVSAAAKIVDEWNKLRGPPLPGGMASAAHRTAPAEIEPARLESSEVPNTLPVADVVAPRPTASVVSTFAHRCAVATFALAIVGFALAFSAEVFDQSDKSAKASEENRRQYESLRTVTQTLERTTQTLATAQASLETARLTLAAAARLQANVLQAQSTFDTMNIAVEVRLPRLGEKDEYYEKLARRAAEMAKLLSEPGGPRQSQGLEVISFSRSPEGEVDIGAIRVLFGGMPSSRSVNGRWLQALQAKMRVFGQPVDVSSLKLRAMPGATSPDLSVKIEGYGITTFDRLRLTYIPRSRELYWNPAGDYDLPSVEYRIGANSLYFLQNALVVMTFSDSPPEDPVFAKGLTQLSIEGLEIRAKGHIFSLPGQLFHHIQSADGIDAWWADLSKSGGAELQFQTREGRKVPYFESPTKSKVP